MLQFIYLLFEFYNTVSIYCTSDHHDDKNCFGFDDVDDLGLGLSPHHDENHHRSRLSHDLDPIHTYIHTQERKINNQCISSQRHLRLSLENLTNNNSYKCFNEYIKMQHS